MEDNKQKSNHEFLRIIAYVLIAAGFLFFLYFAGMNGLHSLNIL